MCVGVRCVRGLGVGGRGVCVCACMSSDTRALTSGSLLSSLVTIPVSLLNKHLGPPHPYLSLLDH